MASYRDSGQDLSRVYRRAETQKRFWLQRLLLPILRTVLLLVGFRVRGEVPPGPLLILSSHSSYLDPFLFALLGGKPPLRFVAKSQLFRPLQRRALLSLGAFPVRRGRRDNEAFAVALRSLQRGQRVVVFPQGGIQKKILLEQAKWGAGFVARRAEAPVVPVLLLRREILIGSPLSLDCRSDIGASRIALQAIAALETGE